MPRPSAHPAFPGKLVKDMTGTAGCVGRRLSFLEGVAGGPSSVHLRLGVRQRPGSDMPYILVSTQVRMVGPILWEQLMMQTLLLGLRNVGRRSSATMLPILSSCRNCRHPKSHSSATTCKPFLRPIPLLMYVPLSSTEWRTDHPPRVVLNKLLDEGYRVVGMAGIGQTCAWTLFKDNTS